MSKSAKDILVIVVFAALVIAGFYFFLSRENDMGKALREGEPTASPFTELGPDVEFFPTHESRGMQALLRGKLYFQNGCLFGGAPSDRVLIIWPNGYIYDRADGGQVLDGDGILVAAMNEQVNLAGGLATKALVDEALDEPIPQACRPKSEDELIWLVTPEPEA